MSPAENWREALVDQMDSARSEERADPALSPVRGLSPIPRSRTASLAEDNETMANTTCEMDAVSIASTASIADYTGRKPFNLPNGNTKTVYEAWEIVSSNDTTHWSTWKRFCGIDFGIRRTSLNDGFADIRPILNYEQGELVDIHADAIREYENSSRKKTGSSYAQDLANRAFRLPANVYNELQLVVDDRTKATNRSPFRQREWRVVVLQKGEFEMTDLLPERKKRGIFGRKREPPAMRRWFVVLRGGEAKSTKEEGGWRMFDRHTNPWWRMDTRETRATRKEGRERQETSLPGLNERYE